MPECGPCTLCCKLLAVPELDKPQDAWCPHAKHKRGCGIYADRPDRCREFKCMWLNGLGNGNLDLRPDRIHGVLTSTTDGENICLHEDPGYRGHARQTLKLMLESWRALGPDRYVIIVCGAERVFIGHPEKFKQLQAGAYVTVPVMATEAI